MASTTMLRCALRTSSHSFLRPAIRLPRRAPTSPIVCLASSVPRAGFSSTCVKRSGSHDEETFEEFNDRYEKEFDMVQDVFELQRNLNNVFAYDLVPSPAVITAAVRASRRVNDFPTAVRVFEGVKAKVENQHQYKEYLEELKPLREELGILLKEELYPQNSDSPFYKG